MHSICCFQYFMTKHILFGLILTWLKHQPQKILHLHPNKNCYKHDSGLRDWTFSLVTRFNEYCREPAWIAHLVVYQLREQQIWISKPGRVSFCINFIFFHWIWITLKELTSLFQSLTNWNIMQTHNCSVVPTIYPCFISQVCKQFKLPYNNK